jgi:AhpD family alkylhydroperoxidase
MQRIDGYEPGNGSSRADKALEGILEMLGFVPNFHKVLAVSPAAIDGFSYMRQALQDVSLAPVEREIIALEVSRRMLCPYCIAAHSKFARMHKVSDLADSDLKELSQAGLDHVTLTEIVAVIGWYVWATMVNNVAVTDIDPYWLE